MTQLHSSMYAVAMTKLRNTPALSLLAVAVILAGASAQATAQAAKPAPAAAAAAAAKHAAAAAAAAPTAPIVEASEIQTLRITTSLQDFQLNQATITSAQGQVEPMRQALIHAIASAAQELHLTPDYQWDFQQKKFIKPQPAAPAVAAATPAPFPAKK